MAENYLVNYDINVNSQQALESIRKFQEATSKLNECERKLTAFQKKIEAVNAKFSKMVNKVPVFDISTNKVNQKLDGVITKLEKIQVLAKKTSTLSVEEVSGTMRDWRNLGNKDLEINTTPLIASHLINYTGNPETNSFINIWTGLKSMMGSILSFFKDLKVLVGLKKDLPNLVGALWGLWSAVGLMKQGNILTTIQNIGRKSWGVFTERVGAARTKTLTTLAQMGGMNLAGNSGVAGASAVGSRFLSAVPWLGAVAAVGTLAAGIYNVYSHMQDLNKTYDSWYEKVYATNGYLSEGLTPTEQYLKLVHDKQLSANEKVSEYIRLRRIQMGLESEAMANLEGKTIYDIYKDQIDKVEDTPWYSFLLRSANIAATWENGQTPLQYLPESIKKQYNFESFTDLEGNYHAKIQKDGKRYKDDNFRRDMFAATMGYEFPQAKEIIEEFTEAFKYSPLEEWDGIRERIILRLEEYKDKIKPEYGNLSLKKLGKLDASEILSVPLAYEAFSNRILQAFDFNGDNEIAKALASQQELFKKAGEWSLEEQAKMLADNGIGFFKNLTGSFDEWTRSYGFDPESKKFIQYGSQTADQWAQKAFQEMTTDVVGFLGGFSEEFREKFTILNAPFFQEAYRHTGEINDKKPQIGQRQEINGILSECIFNGPTGKYEWVPIAGNRNSFTGLGGNTGSNTGADQSQYRSHYSSDAAAPKQVIVRIENLMNVKSIDMTNSNNIATIENIKGQLTQALIDVVHDFDDTFHG